MATSTSRIAHAIALALVAALAGPVVVAAADPPAFRTPVPVVRTLPNGLRVAVFVERRLPIVQMQLLVPAGVAQEVAQTPGVAGITAQLLRSGTSSRSAAAFAADVDRLGGNILGTAARDFSAVSGAFLAADFDAGLELLADAVVNPIFPPEEVDRLREQSAAALLRLRQDPAALADAALWALAFDGHPYGRYPVGTLESLGRLDRQAVRAFHRDFYRPDRAILAIAGDVDAEQAFAAAADRFGNWAGRSAAPPGPPALRAAMRIRVLDRPDQDHSQVRLGLLCPPRADPDALPLQVANHLLAGGGSSSRLARSLRGDGGSSPEVSSGYSILKDGGLLSLGAAVRSDSVAILVAGIRDELARMAREHPGEAEVAAARRYLEHSHPLQFQTLGALLAQWLGAGLYGLTSAWLDHYVENVRAVTAEQVAGAASRWLDPARMAVVVVGPAATLQERLRALGPVEVVSAGGAPVVATPVQAQASPEQQRRGRELLEQALVAHGGLERLRRVKDSSVAGDLLLRLGGSDVEIQMQQVRKEPSRLRYSTQVAGMENGQVLNGAHGWLYLSTADSLEVMDADSLGMEAMRSAFRSDVVHTLLDAAAPSAAVVWRGPGTADGRDADLLEVRLAPPPGGGPAEWRLLHLDATDHRLIAEDRGDPRATAGRGAVRRIFRDYRLVKGVLWPYHEEALQDGTRTMLILLRSVSINTGVADGLFERPVRQTEERPLR